MATTKKSSKKPAASGVAEPPVTTFEVERHGNAMEIVVFADDVSEAMNELEV